MAASRFQKLKTYSDDSGFSLLSSSLKQLWGTSAACHLHYLFCCQPLWAHLSPLTTAPLSFHGYTTGKQLGPSLPGPSPDLEHSPRPSPHHSCLNQVSEQKITFSESLTVWTLKYVPLSCCANTPVPDLLARHFQDSLFSVLTRLREQGTPCTVSYYSTRIQKVWKVL